LEGRGKAIFPFADSLAVLDRTDSQNERLQLLHRSLQQHCGIVDRVALTLFDSANGLLTSFVASPVEENPLVHYQAPLASMKSLQEAAETGRPRVVNDLDPFIVSPSHHAQRIIGHGFASGVAWPLFRQRQLAGFLFFNSYRKNAFRDRQLETLAIFAHLISNHLLGELDAVRTLVAALRVAGGLVHDMEPEPADHLERMSRFCSLIALELCRSGRWNLDDEFIQLLTICAPLHDVGKIGLPTDILWKNGRLNTTEKEVVHTHPGKGAALVGDVMAAHRGHPGAMAGLVRNIALLHHETLDGRGYPEGRGGEDIPPEARITAVADVFDSLTSPRSFRPAWNNDQAFALLRLLAIDKLDPDCVEALVNNRDGIEAIQMTFPSPTP